MQKEKEALERALAYENGILMSDQIVKREPNLHRRTSYAAATEQPKKKRVKRDDEGQGTLQEPEKKNKACHACRRVKVSG